MRALVVNRWMDSNHGTRRKCALRDAAGLKLFGRDKPNTPLSVCVCVHSRTNGAVHVRSTKETSHRFYLAAAIELLISQ